MQKYPPLHIDINITIKSEDCCSEAPDTCNVLLQQYGWLAGLLGNTITEKGFLLLQIIISLSTVHLFRENQFRGQEGTYCGPFL